MNRRAVVTGIGVISPLGNSVKELWEALLANRSGVRAMPEWYDHFGKNIANAPVSVDPVQVKKINRKKPLRRVLKSGLTAILWLLTVILYFVISFASGSWHLTWLIFPCAVIVQTFSSIFFQD